MAQLKRNHGGYRSHGLWSKYQQPAINEKPAKSKAKKDTVKWCRGKKGTEHELRRFFVYVSGWDWRRKTSRTHCKCINCGKEFYGKHKEVPLVIEPAYNYKDSFPVQVKVNGLVLAIDARRYDNDAYLCAQCKEWHYD